MFDKIVSLLKPDGLSPWRQKSLLAVAIMSFCWSTSSLMVFSVLPAFLVDELGTSHVKIGLMEGVAVFLAFAAKVVTGICSDLWRVRKPFILLGTVFTVLTKGFFFFANSIYFIFAARFFDRIAKGVRSAPTDALLADLGNQRTYGSVYGIRQALYTFGGVCGALAATLCMFSSNNSYRLVFLVAIIPAAISLWICIYFVAGPELPEHKHGQSSLWVLKDIRFLPTEFWLLMVVTTFLMLARFSEAFLSLRAKELAWPVFLLPVLIIVMDLVHAAVALLVGRSEDKFPKRSLLLVGLAFFVLADFILAIAYNNLLVVAGFVCIGVHMGITQGLLRALVARSTPAYLRGTAFAIFYMVSGLGVLIGNGLAGYCADKFGLYSVFICGGILSFVALFLWWMIDYVRVLRLVQSP